LELTNKLITLATKMKVETNRSNLHTVECRYKQLQYSMFRLTNGIHSTGPDGTGVCNFLPVCFDTNPGDE